MKTATEVMIEWQSAQGRPTHVLDEWGGLDDSGVPIVTVASCYEYSHPTIEEILGE